MCVVCVCVLLPLTEAGEGAHVKCVLRKEDVTVVLLRIRVRHHVETGALVLYEAGAALDVVCVCVSRRSTGLITHSAESNLPLVITYLCVCV